MKSYIKEIKCLFLLSFPLMLAQFFNIGKEMVDTMMVGNIDKYNLAGMALAASIYALFSWFYICFNGGLISVFSRLIGSKDYSQLKNKIHQSFYLNIIISIIATIILTNSHVFFQFLNVENQTKQIASDYLFVLGCFSLIVNIFNNFKVILLGFKNNNSILIVSLGSFLLNIPLNYIFIYVLNMGAVGCAISTVICYLIEFTILFVFVVKIKKIDIFSNLSIFNPKEIKILFNICFPIALDVIIFVAVFTAIAFVLADYGESLISAHQIMFSIFSVCLTFITGVGTATLQQVSHSLGENNLSKVKTIIIHTFGFVVIFTIIESFFTLFFKEEILSLYTEEQDVIKIALKAILIAPFFQLCDNMRVFSRSILRSYDKNKEMLFISAPTYWVIAFLIGGYLSKDYGVIGFWSSLSLCYFIITVIQFIYIYSLIWKREETMVKFYK